jgi:hypothetical protein
MRHFRKAGHAPTLIAAFLYFDVSFMVWVILGPLAPFLAESLKLTATQKGLGHPAAGRFVLPAHSRMDDGAHRRPSHGAHRPGRDSDPARRGLAGGEPL